MSARPTPPYQAREPPVNWPYLKPAVHRPDRAVAKEEHGSIVARPCNVEELLCIKRLVCNDLPRVGVNDGHTYAGAMHENARRKLTTRAGRRAGEASSKERRAHRFGIAQEACCLRPAAKRASSARQCRAT